MGIHGSAEEEEEEHSTEGRVGTSPTDNSNSHKFYKGVTETENWGCLAEGKL